MCATTSSQTVLCHFRWSEKATFARIRTKEESSESARVPPSTFCADQLGSFGFMDGLSQPLIQGLDDQAPHGRQPQGKEPKAVKPG